MTRERLFKVHYQETIFHPTACGLDGTTTRVLNDVTCRICKFKYLAGQARWAQQFLDELRGRVGSSKPLAVSVPAATTEPVNGVVEGSRVALGRPFTQQGGSQKAISELLPVAAAQLAAIKEVVYHGRAPAVPAGVQPGQVAEQSGNTGEISDETYRNLQATER